MSNGLGALKQPRIPKGGKISMVVQITGCNLLGTLDKLCDRRCYRAGQDGASRNADAGDQQTEDEQSVLQFPVWRHRPFARLQDDGKNETKHDSTGFRGNGCGDVRSILRY